MSLNAFKSETINKKVHSLLDQDSSLMDHQGVVSHIWWCFEKDNLSYNSDWWERLSLKSTK